MTWPVNISNRVSRETGLNVHCNKRSQEELGNSVFLILLAEATRTSVRADCRRASGLLDANLCNGFLGTIVSYRQGTVPRSPEAQGKLVWLTGMWLVWDQPPPDCFLGAAGDPCSLARQEGAGEPPLVRMPETCNGGC